MATVIYVDALIKWSFIVSKSVYIRHTTNITRVNLHQEWEDFITRHKNATRNLKSTLGL